MFRRFISWRFSHECLHPLPISRDRDLVVVCLMLNYYLETCHSSNAYPSFLYTLLYALGNTYRDLEALPFIVARRATFECLSERKAFRAEVN